MIYLQMMRAAVGGKDMPCLVGIAPSKKYLPASMFMYHSLHPADRILGPHNDNEQVVVMSHGLQNKFE